MTDINPKHADNNQNPQESPEEDDSSVNLLRERVIQSLKDQGFVLTESGIQPPDHTDKELLRRLHFLAVQHRIERASGLRSKEPMLIERIAAGSEVNPHCIAPRLVEVLPGTQDELLFRYAALHWSIPVSSGYGRRIRFLVLDSHNNRLIGVIGIGDPVFGLAARDQWIGWNSSERRIRLRHVLDAYVLGAVPPYSNLLGGKLIAMLATSNEVRSTFERKYAQKTALISGASGDSRVAMLTTTSALGRSSMYNRIRFHGRLVFEPVGFTLGSGEFHFANGLYDELYSFVEANCSPTAKNKNWGTGFRSRREVVRKALRKLGLPHSLNFHGIRRQVFVAPLATNSRQFLSGYENVLDYSCSDMESLFSHFKERWLLPRAGRNKSYRKFDPKTYLLWNK
ncbi:MAG: DUF4338 domain-containing protein [Chloroflexi bacterium]|nr:DUF4338 domain-containing protein [Chloroflexota bacterium]